MSRLHKGGVSLSAGLCQVTEPEGRIQLFVAAQQNVQKWTCSVNSFKNLLDDCAERGI